jgi:hypothetical protein
MQLDDLSTTQNRYPLVVGAENLPLRSPSAVAKAACSKSDASGTAQVDIRVNERESIQPIQAPSRRSRVAAGFTAVSAFTDTTPSALQA